MTRRSLVEQSAPQHSSTAAAPVNADHLTRKDYVDIGDATVAADLSDHISDTTDAHNASAISFADLDGTFIPESDVEHAIGFVHQQFIDHVNDVGMPKHQAGHVETDNSGWSGVLDGAIQEDVQTALNVIDTAAASSSDVAAVQAAVDAVWSPGDIKKTVSASTPAGWLAFGTNYLSADTNYPDLWAVVPAAWKSGSTLSLPNIDGLDLVEGASLGTISGSDSLTEAQLAPHDHAFSTGGPNTNTSGAPSTSNTGNNLTDHSHSMQNHTHNTNPASASVIPTGNSAERLWASSAGVPFPSGGTGIVTHGTSGFNGGASYEGEMKVDIPSTTSGGPSTASTGGNSVDHAHSLNNHTHSLQSHAHSGTTESAGAEGNTHNHPQMQVRHLIKT